MDAGHSLSGILDFFVTSCPLDPCRKLLDPLTSISEQGADSLSAGDHQDTHAVSEHAPARENDVTAERRMARHVSALTAIFKHRKSLCKHHVMRNASDPKQVEIVYYTAFNRPVLLRAQAPSGRREDAKWVPMVPLLAHDMMDVSGDGGGKASDVGGVDDAKGGQSGDQYALCDLLPRVVVSEYVKEVVCGGAQLMEAGLLWLGAGDELWSTRPFEANDIVALCVRTEALPFAVGLAARSSAAFHERRRDGTPPQGAAVVVLHAESDPLMTFAMEMDFEPYSGMTCPLPDGYVPGTVKGADGEAHDEDEAAVQAGSSSSDDVESYSEGDEHDVTDVECTLASVEELGIESDEILEDGTVEWDGSDNEDDAEAECVRSERVDEAMAGAGSVLAKVIDSLEGSDGVASPISDVGKMEHGDADSMSAEEAGADEKKKKKKKSSSSPESVAARKEHMDALLQETMIRSMCSTHKLSLGSLALGRHERVSLPLQPDRMKDFVREFLWPYRGASVDTLNLKQSSYRDVTAFLIDMQKKNLVVVVTMGKRGLRLVDLNLQHELVMCNRADFQRVKPRRRNVVVADGPGDTNDTHPSACPMIVEEAVRIGSCNAAVVAAFAELDILPGVFYRKTHILNAMKAYVGEQNLRVMEDVALDSVLALLTGRREGMSVKAASLFTSRTAISSLNCFSSLYRLTPRIRKVRDELHSVGESCKTMLNGRMPRWAAKGDELVIGDQPLEGLLGGMLRRLPEGTKRFANLCRDVRMKGGSIPTLRVAQQPIRGRQRQYVTGIDQPSRLKVTLKQATQMCVRAFGARPFIERGTGRLLIQGVRQVSDLAAAFNVPQSLLWQDPKKHIKPRSWDAPQSKRRGKRRRRR